MRIEFISHDLDEATATCGLLWWRRWTRVERTQRWPGSDEQVWIYTNSRALVEAWLVRLLDLAVGAEVVKRQRIADRERYELDWQRVPRPRPAKALVVGRRAR